MNENRKKNAVFDGTGNLGFALALCWARAAHEVIIGSKMEDKAQQPTSEINERIGHDSVQGKENVAAAKAAEIVVMTVSYASYDATMYQAAFV